MPFPFFHQDLGTTQRFCQTSTHEPAESSHVAGKSGPWNDLGAAALGPVRAKEIPERINCMPE